MPRPEYTDRSKKTIYAEVEPEIKAMLGDIVYALDSTEKDSLPIIIRYYYHHQGVKPRPSRRGNSKSS